ncbi:hypothetical protein N7485_002228 [Penicillium canescens]|nr:hypothetical protein N7485_002228 [Penicillium canescens]
MVIWMGRSMEIPASSAATTTGSSGSSSNGVINVTPIGEAAETDDRDSDTEMDDPHTSIPSSASDAGVPIEAQHRYHQQEMVQTAISERVRTLQAQQLSDEEFLAQEARQWNHRCWLCVQAQRDDVQHDLWSCPAGESAECRRWVRAIRDSIQYIAGGFYCCYSCGMPQSICPGWEAGQQCEYRQFLYPMMAMLIHWQWADGRQGGYEWWRQRMKSANIRVTDLDAVRAYLAQSVDTRHSRLAHEYVWLRRMYQEYGFS